MRQAVRTILRGAAATMPFNKYDFATAMEMAQAANDLVATIAPR